VNAEAALDERRANDSRVARGEGKELGRVEVKVQEGARRAGNEAQLKSARAQSVPQFIPPFWGLARARAQVPSRSDWSSHLRFCGRWTSSSYALLSLALTVEDSMRPPIEASRSVTVIALESRGRMRAPARGSRPPLSFHCVARLLNIALATAFQSPGRQPLTRTTTCAVRRYDAPGRQSTR
jgi:hypothetical protein